jgi:hypothetical protein
MKDSRPSILPSSGHGPAGPKDNNPVVKFTTPFNDSQAIDLTAADFGKRGHVQNAVFLWCHQNSRGLFCGQVNASEL